LIDLESNQFWLRSLFFMPNDKTELHLRHPKTLGISFHVWTEYVQMYFDEKKLPLTLDTTTLATLHRNDATAYEVYFYERLKSIEAGTGKVTVSWTDEQGDCELHLTNNAQLRRFYQITENQLKASMEIQTRFKYGEGGLQ
jgi:hypothetical protein